jgi:hypothetical protein
MNLVNGFASGNILIGKIIDKPCQVKGFESSYHWHRLKVVRNKENLLHHIDNKLEIGMASNGKTGISMIN